MRKLSTTNSTESVFGLSWFSTDSTAKECYYSTWANIANADPATNKTGTFTEKCRIMFSENCTKPYWYE